MASAFRIDVCDEEGADTVSGVFQQVGQWLERRLETKMKRKLQGMQQQLEEKDAAIRALQQLVNTQKSPTAAQRSGGEAAAAAAAGALKMPPLPRLGAAEEPRQVEQLVREVEERVADASISPCRLGEALCVASFMGKLEEVRTLLDSGANVNYTANKVLALSQRGLTPLLAALVNDVDLDVVSLLLERGADVTSVDVRAYSALHYAAENDYGGRCVELLIGAGADVNARSLHGTTPLHGAAQWGNVVAVRALLAAGARRELKGWDSLNQNKTPLDLATSPTVRDLLSAGL